MRRNAQLKDRSIEFSGNFSLHSLRFTLYKHLIGGAMEKATNKTQPAKPSKIKRTAKFLFDIPAWIGTSNIGDYTKWLKTLFASAFLKKTQNDTEPPPVDFAQAMQQQGLDETALKNQLRVYKRSSWLFFALTLGAVGYLVYLWFHASWIICFAGVVVCILLALKTYFYSFWSMQIGNRKLGCSFNDWLAWIVKGKI